MSSNYRNRSSKKPVKRKPPKPLDGPESHAEPVSGRTEGNPLNTKEWRSLVRWTLRTQGTVCHLCGHGGADSGDHVIPRSEDPSLTFEATNIRPAHHKPCPACGIRCNMVRGNMSVEAARRKIRRIQEERAGTGAVSPVICDDGDEW